MSVSLHTGRFKGVKSLNREISLHITLRMLNDFVLSHLLYGADVDMDFSDGDIGLPEAFSPFSIP